MSESFEGVLFLDTEEPHRELALLGILGGAAYDGLVALAAKSNDAVLATRDARAKATYDLVGITVHLVNFAPSSGR